MPVSPAPVGTEPGTRIPICPACGSSAHRSFSAREMMFGWRHTFEYLECRECTSLQIRELPADLGRYYAGEYYSFAPPKQRSTWRTRAKESWLRHLLGERSLIGLVAERFVAPPPSLEWIQRAGVARSARVLDVGCGNGKLLLELRQAGFKSLTGVDPFVGETLHYAHGVRVLKEQLGQHQGEYDWVMMHHALEHCPDPRSVLGDLARLTRLGGVALVRLPVVGYAWREYGPDWVQLDAPRHLFVPSVESMRSLATSVGFEVEQVVFDSTELQFWGSEQYRRGIPLHDPRSLAQNPHAPTFTRHELQEFTRRTRELNEAGDGDQAAFYLRRAA